MTTTTSTTTMTNTSNMTDPTKTTDARSRLLWQPAFVCGAVAAVVATATAAIAHAAGVSFEADGEPIPVTGFAMMTLLGALLGLVIAVLCRRAAHPRAVFARITVALTAMSIVPDLTMSFDAASRIMLVLIHVTAAAIVVPVLARRLPVR
ncbi:MAG: cell envelope biosis protein OmpA [Ilumatobacteraceae bacterium]|nr:cell envelope biosis protein OmpA [Ilumatobacteraceae bacterium]MCU1387073.1 cell envelope biosis protein OmpA [Ilumatobacteraceae bacterium]